MINVKLNNRVYNVDANRHDGFTIKPSHGPVELDLDAATKPVLVCGSNHHTGTIDVTFHPENYGGKFFHVREERETGEERDDGGAVYNVTEWNEFPPLSVVEFSNAIGYGHLSCVEIVPYGAEDFKDKVQAHRDHLINVFRACIAALEQNAPVKDVEQFFEGAI